MSLRLTPLRERRGDILPLARRAIQACARGGHAALSLSAEAEGKLLRYDWPGNARELANIVQRAAGWPPAGSFMRPISIRAMPRLLRAPRVWQPPRAAPPARRSPA